MRTSPSGRCDGKPSGRRGAVPGADIKLTQAGEGATVLAVCGVYRLPLGSLGAGQDRLVLHRSPQTTIRAFTHRIGAAITDPAISPAAADTGLLPAFPP